jgi:predicted ABC-type transport system involved in lysophospholipase L1 biosynthesis ATPase subunit
VSVLAFHHVWKSYPQPAGRELHALSDVTLEVAPGSRVAITGRSGSGKSTLLHLAAGIDRPSRGGVMLLGRDLSRMSDRERSLQRRDHVGLVFQFFHLLPHLSLEDNVGLPALIAGDARGAWAARARELLERVGLGARAADTVDKLSGGEMQRVAICRALLRRPRLLLADEPTGNLDDETGRLVMELLLELTRQEGSTLIYVTHSRELAALAEHGFRLQSGKLQAGSS